MQLRLYLLGEFGAEVASQAVPDGAWGRRAAADVVKYLAMQEGHSVHPEVLIDALWPELACDAATNKFHKAIYAARRALEPGLGRRCRSAFLRVSDTVVSLENADVDVDWFERMVQRALVSGNRDDIERALAAYRGSLLPGDCYRDWTLVRRQELAGLRRRLTLQLVSILEAQGAFSVAVEHLHRLLREDHLDEVVHRRIVELHVRAGSPDEALRQYGILRDALASEGESPDETTERLHSTIVAVSVGDPDLVPSASVRRRAAAGNARLGRTLYDKGRYDEALGHLERAAGMYLALGDVDGRAHTIAAIGRVHFARSAAPEGVTLLEGVDQGCLSSEVRADLLASLAALYWLRCDYARQLQIAEAGEALAAGAADEAVRVEAAVWRGVALVAVESVDEGIGVLGRAADDAERVGDARSASRALNTIAAALHERGDCEQERDYVERALVHAARSGDPARLTFMLYRAGWNAYDLGRWEDAQRYLERAVAVSEPFSDVWSRPYALHGLAWLHLCRGENGEARWWAELAVRGVERGGDRRALWSLQGLLGHLELAEGRPGRAVELFWRALEGPGLTEADQGMLLAAVVLAELRRGGVISARQSLERALALAEGSGSKLALFEARIA